LQKSSDHFSFVQGYTVLLSWLRKNLDSVISCEA